MTERKMPIGPRPVVLDDDDRRTDEYKDELLALLHDLQPALGVAQGIEKFEEGVETSVGIATSNPSLVVALMSAYRTALFGSLDLATFMRDNFDLEAYLTPLVQEQTGADGTETPDDPMNPGYMIEYVLWFRPRVASGVLAAARTLRELHGLDERAFDGRAPGSPRGHR